VRGATAGVGFDEAIHFVPPLWLKQDTDVVAVSRKAIPADGLSPCRARVRPSIAGLPDGTFVEIDLP
jgi:hypothetical protein